MGKRADYAALKAGFGLARGLSDEFIQACVRVNPPIEAIHRLVTPNGRTTMDEMVRRAVTDWQQEQPKPAEPSTHSDHPYRGGGEVNGLPANHYLVPVTYAPLPSFAELEKEFGKGNVSDIFDGRPFTLHTSCQDMDRAPGEKAFYVHDACRDWESEERIAWGLKQRSAVAPNGYRPAGAEETYEFAKAHPELLDFVGLGSSALGGDLLFVAGVWCYGCRRILGYDEFGGGWARGCRVLFVSK